MRRIALVTALATLLAVATPGPAGADDIAVVAQVLPGSRTITTATLTPFSDALRAASVDSTLAVTVTEAAVSGVTPWSVSARLCGPNGDNTASDCVTEADRIVLAADHDLEIAGENLELSERAVVPVLGGGTSTPTAGEEDLSTSRTLFTNTGQDPLVLYTGTYASTATVTLTPPASAATGAYTGYIVVTLVS